MHQYEKKKEERPFSQFSMYFKCVQCDRRMRQWDDLNVNASCCEWNEMFQCKSTILIVFIYLLFIR